MGAFTLKSVTTPKMLNGTDLTLSFGVNQDIKMSFFFFFYKRSFTLKATSRLQQMTNFASSFLVFDKNKVLYFMRILLQQMMLMKNQTLFVNF